MARPLFKLSATSVRALPPGKYNDGGGLWLFKRGDGGGQWVLRFTTGGRRREMGLGSLTTVSLKAARDSASKYRMDAQGGKDPISERRRRQFSTVNDVSLRTIAEKAFEARKAELKGEGLAGRWFSPLETHVLPKLGKVPVELIDQVRIHDVLAPIWHTKADVARKALNRLAIVLRYAAAMGLNVDTSACSKTRELLGKTRHVTKNIPSMPWHEVPRFYAELTNPTPSHLALRLLILTGVRSGPLRCLRLEEIEGDVWTIPAAKMKGSPGAVGDFRVPLSREALGTIEQALPYSRSGYLFASSAGRPISDMTISMIMRRNGLAARPHGFRTSLRTWLAECTDASHDLSEAVLGHAVGNKVSRAYQRSDLLEQRRVLLDRWATFVSMPRC
jgi:integrase